MLWLTLAFHTFVFFLRVMRHILKTSWIPFAVQLEKGIQREMYAKVGAITGLMSPKPVQSAHLIKCRPCSQPSLHQHFFNHMDAIRQTCHAWQNMAVRQCSALWCTAVRFGAF